MTKKKKMPTMLLRTQKAMIAPMMPTAVTATAVKVDLAPVKARVTDLLNRRSVLGVLLGVLAVGSGIALTATAAWLIARASQQPPEAALAVAVVAVRAFGLGKGALRYLERLVTHDHSSTAACLLGILGCVEQPIDPVGKPP